MLATPQSTFRNKLIGALSPADFSALSPHLAPVKFTKNATLTRPGMSMMHCWFIEDGIASVLATSSSGRGAEVGVIGFEGMIDVSVCLGFDTPRLRSFIQLAGTGYRVPVSIIRQMIETRPAVRKLLLAYVYDFLTQVSHTAFVNANLPIEARLARWLLMYDDRIVDGPLTITHEFLSTMLGVRRAGVTVALAHLREAGLITLQRSALTIIDRNGLEAAAGEGYGWFEWPKSEVPIELQIAV